MLDRRTPADGPRGRWLPVALGAVSAFAGMLAATPNGTAVILLACIAALVAGSDGAFGAALAVAGAGVLSVMASLVVTGGASAAAMVGPPLAIGAGLILGLHRRTYRPRPNRPRCCWRGPRSYGSNSAAPTYWTSGPASRGRSTTAQLFLSGHTVKTHINRIFAKTGSRDRMAAARYAGDHGLA